MKKYVLVATMMVIVVVAAPTPMSAQSADSLVVNIPFKFIVKNRTFPAGKYIVKRCFSDKPDVLSLASSDGGARECLVTSSLRRTTVQSESKLVFRRYGDEYFLSQIWEVESSRDTI